MAHRIRVEITARNDYWLNAVFVEWEDQFPARRLEKAAEQIYLIEADWLADLQRVAGQVFGQIRLAPDDPGRRRLFRALLPGGKRQ